MIPKECRRLAEVDFPIAEVSKHSVREKSIRHGHPSTLHLWWARRPLAACRAMLLGLLWPDPCDPHCPEVFKEKARQLVPRVQGTVGPTDEDLRKALLRFIGDFARWDLSSNCSYLEVSRELVKAAHGGEPPLVADPFAGGGSIPLEALRSGCEAFASDLNPVACLILKVLLEDIPRCGPDLAEQLLQVGSEIRREAEKELAESYPISPDGATPITYLWARTTRCESPNCGAEIPLVRSLWLCRKANRKRALRYNVIRTNGEPPQVQFEVFKPNAEKDVPDGTVTRAKARCPVCGMVLPSERVRAQLAAQRGGADVILDQNGKRSGGARLLAVVTLRPGEPGRHYRLPDEQDYGAVWKAQQRLKEALDEWESGDRRGVCPVPDEPLPLMSGTFNVPLYGMSRWGDLFTARQKVALVTLTRLTREIQRVGRDGSFVDLLGLALTRTVNAGCSLCRWDVTRENHQGVYSRQALPIVWDFSEANPLSTATGGYAGALDWVRNVIEAWPGSSVGQVQCADAGLSPLPAESVSVWFTDPPYYFAVPYADLSDFFFVWLKRALPGHALLRDPFDPTNTLTPKEPELCQMAHWDPERCRHKDQSFFETGMTKAFAEGRRVLKEDGIGSVVFAHTTTEGWEALLSGLIKGRWTITGSWPIATEMAARLRARESAVLATSVHLVCRPRSEDAPIGDWADVLRELPKRVGDWMERLQGEGIRGADLVFACIGPALEVFSRYSRVETPEGREVKLAEYLEKVWEVVGRIALEQVLGTAEARARNGAAGAVEQDARLTALFLWTLQTTNGDSEINGGEEAGQGDVTDEDEEEATSRGKTKGCTLVFDVVRRFAQPLGINLPTWEGRIIETKKGVVRLLPVGERARQLFGEDEAQAVANRMEDNRSDGTLQLALFPDFDRGSTPEIRVRRQGRGKKISAAVSDDALMAGRQVTTLDRLHAAMVLQASGRTNALRALLKAEQERGPDFLRLANALSALYPKGSEEKRLLDAMLLAVPR